MVRYLHICYPKGFPVPNLSRWGLPVYDFFPADYHANNVYKIKAVLEKINGREWRWVSWEHDLLLFFQHMMLCVCVLYRWLQFDPPTRTRERSPLWCQPHKNICKQPSLSHWQRWNWQLLAIQGWLMALGTLVPLSPSVPCLLLPPDDSQGAIDTCKPFASKKHLSLCPWRNW